MPLNCFCYVLQELIHLSDPVPMSGHPTPQPVPTMDTNAVVIGGLCFIPA